MGKRTRSSTRFRMEVGRARGSVRGRALAAAAAVACLAFVALSVARGPRVSLRLETVDGGLRARVIAPSRAVAAELLCGPMWRSDEFASLAYRGSSVNILATPEGKPRALARWDELSPGQEVEATISAADLPVGPCAIEVVARPPGDPRMIAARSETFFVRRFGDVVVAEPHLARAWRENGFTVGAIYVVTVLVVLALRRVPFERLHARWLGVAVAGAAVATLLATRVSQPRPVRSHVDAALADPPLVWPTSWSLREDGYERSLGPGFRALVDGARAERRPGEKLSVVIPDTSGLPYMQALHLLAAIHDAELHVAYRGYPPGLAVFFGVASPVNPLQRTAAGALSRTEGPPR
ncbi:MAG TPA: hypothetical protein VKE69_13390 [Planctomycetota bacterium]|nr:hypothetical protein [Planctomycetota bacterium]